MLMRTTAIEYKRSSPKTIVVTLHPGTTDTHLSQPFQKNVPPEKLFSVERTVTQRRDRTVAFRINEMKIIRPGVEEEYPWEKNNLSGNHL